MDSEHRHDSAQTHDHGHPHAHDHAHDHGHSHAPMPFAEPVEELKLTVENLSVAFGRRRVLEDVSLTVEGGQLMSVIGQNGCGKTTLLKAVAGSVTSRLTVFEMVLLGLVRDLSLSLDAKTFDRVDAVLHAMHINTLASEPVHSLSGGQKQLVFMAQAFVSNPRVLLLDEPTSALDLRHQLIVMQAARDYTDRTGAVTLCVVHDLMAAARYSDRLLMLDQGRVRLFAKPEEVLKPELIREVYRVSAHVGVTAPGFLSVVPIEPLA